MFLGRLMTAIFLVAMSAGAASADDFSGDFSESLSERANFCDRWYDSPDQCERTAGCEFDWYSRECTQRNVIPGPGQCSYWDNNPRQCNSTYGCTWDQWNRRCDESSGGGGGTPANQCWRYDRDPQTCNVMRGCQWDHWSGRCSNGGGGGGNGGAGRTQRVTLSCSSNGWSIQDCWAGGTIISAHIQREWSSGHQCIEGRTWGRSHDSIWVDRGCSADFVLTIRR
jgi:hypothetical protein